MSGGTFLATGDYPVVETEGNPYAEGVKELYARLLKYALKKRTDGQALVAVGHLLATGSRLPRKIIVSASSSVVWRVYRPSLFPNRLFIRL